MQTSPGQQLTALRRHPPLVVLYGGALLGAEPPADRGLGAVHWVLLAIVPLVTALLIAFAARMTALFGLARLR